MSFTGTLDKCKACDKTVYFVDLLSADGVTYHKSCFKCSHCKGTLVVCFLRFSITIGLLRLKLKESANYNVLVFHVARFLIYSWQIKGMKMPVPSMI